MKYLKCLKYLLVLLVFLVFTRCSPIIEESQKTFFVELGMGSGIDFRNDIKETEEVNPFLYDNIYSGGGVAVGDINNDGLMDLYFGGNQVGDELYLNEGNMKFRKITKNAGILNKKGWTSGVTMADVNGDGFLDIYVCKTLYDNHVDLRINELYINNGDLTFTESAEEYGLNDPWRSQQATFIDIDNDNDLDVFLVNQPPNPGILSNLAGRDWKLPQLSWRLLENRNNKFVEITKEARVRHSGYGLSVVSGDFNNDGWVDFYVTSDYNNPDYFYINQQNGTFKNTIRESMGHITYFSMGVDAADINNDGLLDLAVVDMVPSDNLHLKANMSGMNPDAFWNTVKEGKHYQYMLNTLQLNRGLSENDQVLFSEISQFSNVAYTDWSWSPLMADFDNDGLKDLFVTNGLLREIRNTDALVNVKDYISDVTEQGRLLTRADLDTLLGFYPARKVSNYIYKNTDGISFDNKSVEWGMDKNVLSMGACYADLDNDGDLDIILNNLNARASVYENVSSNNEFYVRFSLTKGKRKDLFGSRITLKLSSGRELMSELSNARGFYSSSEPVFHFGLLADEKINEAIISWNHEEQSILSQVVVGEHHVIKYEEEEKQTRKFERINPMFTFSTSDVKHAENEFDDYQREILLPHKMSENGPSIASADINKDGLMDFYLPGPIGQQGQLMMNMTEGNFQIINLGTLDIEEVGATFFDADMDGDDDLYVIVGGNEYEVGDEHYADLFYENVNGSFERKRVFPSSHFSGSVAKQTDIDGDGDLDIFVGGRQIPGRYPSPASSKIFLNQWVESGKLAFVDATQQRAPELSDIGMITDGIWTDFDGDDDDDLLLVGEWMPITLFENENGYLKNQTSRLGLDSLKGWWFSLSQNDLDLDGDLDYVIGNLGLNYKYKATMEEPFNVYSGDFDADGSSDIVLSYFNEGNEFPVRGRSCSSQQIPDLKKKFENYTTFASSDIGQVYGESTLRSSLQLEATFFQSIVLENNNGKFIVKPLPKEVQFSPVRTSKILNIDEDDLPDIIFAGNLYQSEIETPRADAGMGGVLINMGDCTFEMLPANKSGFMLNSDVRDLQFFYEEDELYVLAFSNNDQLRIGTMK